MRYTNYRNKQTDQVFISFRGKDERFTFLSHLKQKLKDSNVNVFTDEDAPGEPLKNLFKRIRNSKIAVVIFSENYGESDWCLQELVEIKKCIETKKLKAVIPIFHMVSASAIKRQGGEFGKRFLALQNSLLAKEGIKEYEINCINSKIKRWKKALEVVTGMTGYSYKGNSPEADFVGIVVEKIKISLANIAIEEGRNITQETMEEKQQSNMILFPIIHLSIDSQHLLDSLNLGKWNSKGYSTIQNIDMEPSSHVLKRTNSDLDQLHGPHSVEAMIARMQKDKNQQRIALSEATLTQNQVEYYQRSIDNIVHIRPRGHTTCVSYMHAYFRLFLDGIRIVSGLH